MDERPGVAFKSRSEAGSGLRMELLAGDESTIVIASTGHSAAADVLPEPAKTVD